MYKPCGFYFRKALREARTKAEAVRLGLHAVRELENMKKQLREAGIEPVRRFVLSTEPVAPTPTASPFPVLLVTVSHQDPPLPPERTKSS